MPIEIVINGYYRSGTTFLWDYIKNALPEFKCFYEPLHPDLACLVTAEAHEKKKTPLHDRFLWREYRSLGSDRLERLLRNHPNVSRDGITSDDSLIRYLDIFHEVTDKVLLQPNRLHFYLDILFQKYSAKVIHVIRHPLDVYASLRKAYVLNLPPLKYVARKLLRPVLIHNSFGVAKEYQWVIRHVGYPYTYPTNWSKKYMERFEFMQKFAVVWTVSNYAALRSIEKNGGLLLVYEHLVQEPEMELQRFSDYIGMKLNHPLDVRSKKGGKLSEDMNKWLRNIEKNRLKEMYDYIVKQVKTTSGIDYGRI